MTDRPRRDARHDDEWVAPSDAIIGRAFRWSASVLVVLAVGVGVAIWLMTRPTPSPPPEPVVTAPPEVVRVDAQPPGVAFRDITENAGIDFVHVNGATGEKLLPETMGAGCAFFDYDQDGDADLLFINSTHWPGQAPSDAAAPTSVLYRNDGSGAFTDVTTDSGLDVSLYGTGVAVGDFDNDGWVDVFVAAVGPNRLLRNVRGRFVDVTAGAGVAGDDREWSTSAAFVDVDNDGDLDLFVCNYVRWSRQIDFEVDYRLTGVGRAYGPPTNFAGTQPDLFRNDGDGTFSEVAKAAGLHVNHPTTGAPVGKALGVAPIDVDRDGWIDLVVANDTVRNFFYRNLGGGKFEETAEVSGLAYGPTGQATGAMGIDAGHFRSDGALGFFIGNFANEMTSAYVSQGVATTLFADEAIVQGIGAPSRLMLTFGLFLFDYDLDGRLDLLQVNGHLEDEINKVQASQSYEQPAQLFWNAGPRATQTFVAVDPATTGDLGLPLVARGVAYADIDGDGDLDVAVTQTGRRARLFRNDQQRGHHWLRIKLTGRTCNSDAIGAWIEAEIEGRSIRRQVMPTRSYLSQVELPVTIGLGEAGFIDGLRVNWPDGTTQTIAKPLTDQYLQITQQ